MAAPSPTAAAWRTFKAAAALAPAASASHLKSEGGRVSENLKKSASLYNIRGRKPWNNWTGDRIQISEDYTGPSPQPDIPEAFLTQLLQGTSDKQGAKESSVKQFVISENRSDPIPA